jgi:L-alanine-DL-glutamate epimerase-like enolase superfamily enzyme
MRNISDVQVLSAADTSYRGGSDVVQDLVVVSVQDEGGRRGVGESQSSPAILAAVMGAPASRILQRRLPEIVQGRDPADWESVLDEVLAITRVIGREGVVAHAVGALEIAMLDLQGQQAGKPFWQLINVHAQPAPMGPEAYGTAWYSNTQGALDGLIEKMQRSSLCGLKLAYDKVLPSVAEDRAALARLRQELGASIRLFVDWQTRGTVGDFWERIDNYVDANIEWIEEPFDRDNLRDYGQIAGRSPVRLAAGESETRLIGFRAFADAGVSVLQPDLGRCGLRVAGQVAEMGRAENLVVVPHQWGSDINLSANLHWAIANRLPLLERRFELSDLAERLGRCDLPMVNGRFLLPSGKGLGIEFNSEDWTRLA